MLELLMTALALLVLVPPQMVCVRVSRRLAAMWATFQRVKKAGATPDINERQRPQALGACMGLRPVHGSPELFPWAGHYFAREQTTIEEME